MALHMSKALLTYHALTHLWSCFRVADMFCSCCGCNQHQTASCFVLQLHRPENALHNQSTANLVSPLLLPGRGFQHLLLPPTLQLHELLALVPLVVQSPRVLALHIAQLLLAVCQALLQICDLCSLVSQVGLQLIGPHVQRPSVLHSTGCSCRYENWWRVRP